MERVTKKTVWSAKAKTFMATVQQHGFTPFSNDFIGIVNYLKSVTESVLCSGVSRVNGVRMAAAVTIVRALRNKRASNVSRT